MRLFTLSLAICFCTGCHPNENKPHPGTGQKNKLKDSSVSTTVGYTKATPHLKEMEISGNNLFTGRRIFLSKSAQKMLSIDKIDSVETGDYYIIDTLSFIQQPHTLILLLARKYPEENVAWIAVYHQDKLTDSKEVYYDNAEGFLQVGSIIKADRIHISTINEFDENNMHKKEIFVIDENMRFRKTGR